MSRSVKSIDPQTAAAMMDEGAILVDIREGHELARAHVPGSRHIALSILDETNLYAGKDQSVLFICASGTRTRVHSARLAAKTGENQAYVVEGGLMAWHRAGLPVASG